MRVWFKPQVLAKLGMTVADLVAALNQQNTVNPAGQLSGNPAPPGTAMTYTVRTQGRLVTAEQFGQIVVRANPDGSVVRLQDVARIELGALSYNETSRFDGEPACIIAVFLTPGANAVAVADAARKTMAQLQKRFPPDLTYAIGLDTTLPVTEGIHEILVTLLIAMALVILVVYLFLQNWRATLIPMIAVPVSLIGTFAFFPALGFSINTLSLFGLVLAIGLVVDDAIVVVEAVEHHIEEGLAPREATLQAMREVSGPVVAIALILASVFIPMAFMSGIQGRLNKQFAVTVAISVLISAFNALTLSPALSAMLLRPRKASTGILGRILPRLQLGIRQIAGPLRGDQPGADPQGRGGHGGSRLLYDPGWIHRKEAAYQLSAGRGLRFSFSERATAACRFTGSHHCGCGQGSERAVPHAGRGAFHDDCGVQLSVACLDHQQFLVFCGAEAVVRAAVSQP